jgi:hypothetical protein
MKILTLTAAVVAAALIAGGPALAQSNKANPNCQPSASARGNATTARPPAPEKINGKVEKVDPASGMITVRNTDGTEHQFKGDAETLRQYKQGDNIELTLRQQPC